MTNSPTTALDLGQLAQIWHHFSTVRAANCAPLYARLSGGVCADPDLLAISSQVRAGQSAPSLLLGAVHYLLGRELRHPLASYYPTLTFGHPKKQGDPVPLFREFVLDRRDEVAELLATKWLQTNEVSRSTYLYPGLLAAERLVGQPLSLIEVGTSAGLNLVPDRYAYHYGGELIGQENSPLVLTCDLRGPHHPPLYLPIPDIRWRCGIDVHPIDLADPDAVAWLRALVWADHTARLANLDAAISVAASGGLPPLYGGDALETLPTLLNKAPRDTVAVVMHSETLAHFSVERRQRFAELVPELSQRRPILWLQAEPRADNEPRLRLNVCVGGKVEQTFPLARYHSHGAWLEWTDHGRH